MKSNYYKILRVRAHPNNPKRGRIILPGEMSIPCALGRNGIGTQKREGDGKTPVGLMRCRILFYRADKMPRPTTGLGAQAIRKHDGWCDDVRSSYYNRYVREPFRFSHESLKRKDDVYDLIIVLSWNDAPVYRSRGSAIFFHLARPLYKPTEGCVAVSKTDMMRILRRIGPNTRLLVA